MLTPKRNQDRLTEASAAGKTLVGVSVEVLLQLIFSLLAFRNFYRTDLLQTYSVVYGTLRLEVRF